MRIAAWSDDRDIAFSVAGRIGIGYEGSIGMPAAHAGDREGGRMPATAAGRESAEKRLIGIVADVLGCDASAVLPEASFESLGIDSISILMLTVEVEKAFGIRLPMTIFYECKCIGDFLEWIVAEQTP